MYHDHINKLIKLIGHAVLRKVLARIQSNNPAWFSIIADEATDVTCAEQLNIYCCWFFLFQPCSNA